MRRYGKNVLLNLDYCRGNYAGFGSGIVAHLPSIALYILYVQLGTLTDSYFNHDPEQIIDWISQHKFLVNQNVTA